MNENDEILQLREPKKEHQPYRNKESNKIRNDGLDIINSEDNLNKRRSEMNNNGDIIENNIEVNPNTNNSLSRY